MKMELSDLTAYALEKYQIKEEHRWTDLPGCSVLCHPQTGKWVAFLMRQWDTDTGTEIERCDLRYVQRRLPEGGESYLSSPVRMKGRDWIGVAFNADTESDVVFRLFDEAVAASGQHGYTVTLGSLLTGADSPYHETALPPARADGKNAKPEDAGTVYRETALPPARADGKNAKPEDAGTACRETALPPARAEEKNKKTRDTGTFLREILLPPVRAEEKNAKSEEAGTVFREFVLPPAPYTGEFLREKMPEQLRKMRRMYEYGRESAESRARNFYRQGMFMRDYEDDYPWEGHLVCYYPTYHDLTTKQLRGYFSWRTRVRKGEYRTIAASAAYIYIYELLNGIGTASPEESLRKLKEFEKGFLDAGFGDGRMRSNLHQWMLEYAIIKGLPAETVLQYTDAEQAQRDADLAILKAPESCSDEDVCVALGRMAGKKSDKSPVMTCDPVKGRQLLAASWRRAAAGYCRQDRDLFTLCFGKRHIRSWFPLSNAILYSGNAEDMCGQVPSPVGDREYILNECRTYRCIRGNWQVEAYEKLYFDRELLRGFLHETDALLRRYLKTGRYLRENEKNKWAAPYVAAVIEEDRKAAILAARPKITIDLSGLWQIRRDALKTQNSLLVGEEAIEMPDNLPSSEGAAGLSESLPATEGAAELSDSLPAAEGAAELSDSLPATEGAAELSDSLPSSEGAAKVSYNHCFEDEKAEIEAIPSALGKSAETPEASTASTDLAEQDSGAADIPIDEIHLRILRVLLAGGDVSEIIRGQHLMPSIVADSINEALFDEVGDTVVSCDDEKLSLVEDYIEELEELLGRP